MVSTPRMQVVHQVLEAAKDAGDADTIAACRRLIRANLIGWQKHHNPADFARVQTFYGQETTEAK